MDCRTKKIDHVRKALFAVVLFAGSLNAASGTLTGNIRISSEHLGYDLNYRVYTPGEIEQGRKYPVLFVVDGQVYIWMGMVDVLDELIESGQIQPVFVVFVDPRNPDNPRDNRRGEEYLCNLDYVNFYTAEFLPFLYKTYPISVDRNDTNILGLSFGAINSACFGVMAPNRFSGIGMHSPSNSDHTRHVASFYTATGDYPLRIFLSAGTRNDNFRAAKNFYNTLEKAGFDVHWVVNKGAGHDHKNWRELLDDALLALLPAKTPE